MTYNNIVPPVVNGETLLSLEEFAKIAGLSIDRIRERVSTRSTRRGGFIPSHKSQGRRWFSKASIEALHVASRKNQINSERRPKNTAAHTEQSKVDMSWL